MNEGRRFRDDQCTRNDTRTAVTPIAQGNMLTTNGIV
jgi:hypothetical protein